MDLKALKNKLEANELGKYFDKLQPLLRSTIRPR